MKRNAVAILVENEIYHFTIVDGSKLSIGSSENDTIVRSEMGKTQILIEYKNNTVEMKLNGQHSVPVTLSKNVLNILFNSPKIIIFISDENSNQTITVNIPENKWISIGRNNENDIQVKSSFISRKHMQIMRKHDQLLFKDEGSKNGIYHDGVLCTEGTLEDGDVLFILTLGIRFQGGSISFEGTQFHLINYDPVSLNSVKQEVEADPVPEVEEAENNNYAYSFEQSFAGNYNQRNADPFEYKFNETVLESPGYVPMAQALKEALAREEGKEYFFNDPVKEEVAPEEDIAAREGNGSYFGSKTLVFGVASALNDVGKTSITMALCELLAEEYSVLYINAEVFQTFTFFMDHPEYLRDSWLNDWSDDLSVMALAEKLESEIGEYAGFDYMRPFGNPRTAMATSTNFYKAIVESFRKEYDYDYIFVDMGDMWKEESQELSKCFDYTIMVSSYTRKSVYATNVYHQLHKKDMQNDSVIYIQNNCNNLSETRQMEMNRSIKYPVALEIPFDETVDETVIGDRDSICRLKEIVENKN